MSAMVQVALASTVADAEEIATVLRSAGIEVELESAVEHHPAGTDDAPTRVLVPESELDVAQDALEAFAEPDELDAGA
jgi:hypothetical protein